MLTLLQNYLFTGVTGNAAYDIVVKFWRQTFGKDLQDLFLDAFEQVLDGQRSTLRRYGEPAELDRETLRRALRGDLDVNRASWSDLNQDEFVQLLAQEMRERQALTIGGHNLSADEYQGLLRRLIQGAIANLRRKVLENETAFNHVLLAETAGNREQLQAVRDYLSQRLDLYLQKLELIEAQTRPVPEILDHVQAQGELLQQVADGVQALRPLQPTPPPAHARSDSETAPGGSPRVRLEQRRREHQARWDALGGRIRALQKDLDQETDGERRQTLESRLSQKLAELNQQWQDITDRINAVIKQIGTTTDEERHLTLNKRLQELQNEREKLEPALQAFEAQLDGELAARLDELTYSDDYVQRRLGVPFQAPPLPGHFVPRSEVSDDLKARLLSDETAAPGMLVVSAIHGLGGIGKSVLAAALAHDPEVQEHFPDGVLWAVLGQEPDLLSLLSGWVQALDDYNFRPTTIEAASAHLRTLLHDKATLLVVDDAWDHEHAIPFKVGSPRCQVLITTRRADVADEMGADLYQLGVMTPEQSLNLLSARLRRPLVEMEQEDALCLSKSVGYLPLALDLAAVRVTRGMSWDALRDALEQEIARLEVLEGPRRRRKRDLSLVASLNLSLNSLRAEDEEAWQSFVWLGVLPEDVQVVAPMAATLWEMEQAEAAETLELLWNDALLLSGSPVWIGEQQWPSYRLHDLLHDLSRRLLTAEQPQGLEITLPEAHTRLLERYQTHTQRGLWHTLLDDGYIQAHLTWHMEQAREEDAIHALLREETVEGRNGWYGTRERLEQTAGYLKDVARAWRLTEEALDIRHSPFTIGIQVRYALITASLNSLAKNIPPTLLTALVEKGIWTSTQGLTYAHQVPDSTQRVEALAGLAPHLPEPLRTKTLQTALSVVRSIDRVARIYRVVDAIVSLAPYLPESMITEALAIAQEFPWIYNTKALVALVSRLALLGHWQRAIDTAQTIENHYSRTHSLIALIPHSANSERPRIVQEALNSALMIEWIADKIEALAAIIAHLPDLERSRVSRDALSDAWTIEHTKNRVRSVAALVPHLREPERAEVLNRTLVAAREIEDAKSRVQALIALVPHISEKGRATIVEEVLDASREISNFQHWSEVLSFLVPHSPTTLLQRILVTTQGIENQSHRARSLAVLAPYLAEPERAQVFKEALDIIKVTKNIETRMGVLTSLAPHLSKSQLQNALAAARTIDWPEKQAEALTILTPYLPEVKRIQVIEEALTTTQIIGDAWRQVRALFVLANHLPESPFEEILTVAQTIKANRWKAKALAALATHLPEPKRTQTLKQALAAAWTIRDSSNLVETLAILSPQLPRHLLLKAITTVQQGIRDRSVLVRALIPLADSLPETERLQVFKQALEIAWSLDEGSVLQVQSLAILAHHLPQPLVSDALAMARRLPEQQEFERKRSPRIDVLIALAHRLLEQERIQVLQEALNTARKIGEDTYLAKVLILSIPHLSVSERAQTVEESLVTVQAIKPEWRQAKMLADLVPYLPDSKCDQILQEALAAVQTSQNEQARALTALAPHLPARLLSEAVIIAQAIRDNEHRAQALTSLSLHLQEPKRSQVLKEALVAARGVEFELQRSNVLIELSSHLATLPLTTLSTLWQETLGELTKRSRQDLLADLEALEPVIVRLGGSETVVETFRAIQDVGHWWP